MSLRKTLFIANKVMSEEQWSLCRQRYSGGFVLIESAVLMTEKSVAEQCGLAQLAESYPVYVLEEDSALRGINSENQHSKLTKINYGGFVDLCSEYQTIVNI